MYIVISPSKTQDFSRDFSKSISPDFFSSLHFLRETKKLSTIAKQLSAEELGKMMKLSPKLSELNFSRFQNWNTDFSVREKDNSEYNFSPALFAFLGDVYRGFDLEHWKKSDFLSAQKHLGIISGFYGLLSPLDTIKPYRLEMGTRISFEIEGKKYKNLYAFWEEKITQKINEILETEAILLNLASNEYSKVINRKKLSGTIVDVDFKVLKNGELKTIGIYAKRARGQMANWIIQKGITDIKDVQNFSEDEWNFDAEKSSDKKLVFVKKA